ncbi:WD40/YVTN/BNR-like repeat-containing protein, partial [Robiginitalea sp.]|uniref:WD40/YVTN/BNR-like repeat-containing protein n=1 Tax=Robiginitalea sp. TaxID=1902411 RepID=UPI003C46F565
MKRFFLLLLAAGLFVFQGTPAHAQRKKNKAADAEKQELPLQAFKFRNIGPAFLSGRIADIAMHPENDNVWYVAVGSGGVWKTVNAGTTWTPLFDQQKSYSTGCITLDPSNP